MSEQEEKKKPRITRKILVILLVLSMISTTVLAIVYVIRSFTATFTVIGTYDFNLFSDEACTIIITGQDWGSLQRQTYNEPIFYLKVLSTLDSVAVKWNYTLNGAVSDLRLWAWDKTKYGYPQYEEWPIDAWVTLNPLEVRPMYFVVTIKPDAALGSYSLNIKFWGSGP